MTALLDTLVKAIATSTDHDELADAIRQLLRFEIEEDGTVTSLTIGFPEPAPSIVITPQKIALRGNVTIETANGDVQISDMQHLIGLLFRANVTGAQLGMDYELD